MKKTLIKILIFLQMELSLQKLKKLLTFQEGTGKAPKTKKSASKKFLVSFDVFVILTTVKHMKIPRKYFYSEVK